MNKDLVAIFEYLEREKGIKREIIISAIEESLRAAAHKSVKGMLNVSVQIHPKTGEIEVLAQKEVVDKVSIPEEEISLETAQVLNPKASLGDWIDISVTPHDFGRIAAQTARQIISQKLRCAEKDVIYAEYRDRLNEIVSGTVKRVIGGATLVVDLGKVEAILPDRFYPKTEKYQIGDRVHALLYEMRDTEGGGAEVILSRSHPEFVAQLFAQEVPEINDGTIIIKKIVREAGYRSKLAVISQDPKIDPVGACVGIRGTRVKNIIRELNNEKIDVIPYSEDPIQLLQNALSPIEIKKISTEGSSISIVVDDPDYPKALGQGGLNARLNGRLIGKTLEIKKMSQYQEHMAVLCAQLVGSNDPSLDEPLVIEGMSSLVVETVAGAGFDTPRKLLQATPEQIATAAHISIEMASKILDVVRKKRI